MDQDSTRGKGLGQARDSSWQGYCSSRWRCYEITPLGAGVLRAELARLESDVAFARASRLRPEDTSYLMPEGYNVAPGHLEFMGIPILEGRELHPFGWRSG